VLVKCVKAFGMAVPGDLAEVPDGASVDPDHWVPADAGTETPPEPSEPAAPAAFPPAGTLTPKEM
jgi:hypothetical protein